MSGRDECEHGSLRRACEPCALKEEVADLKARVETAERDLDIARGLIARLGDPDSLESLWALLRYERARVAELEDDFAKRQASHCCPTWNDQMEDCDCDERMGGHIARWQKAEAEVARLRESEARLRAALKGLLLEGCLCAVNEQEELQGKCEACARADAALSGTAPAPLSERERATKEALEECLEALEQAFVDEANCNGLHVPRAHGPRSPNDCFDLWAKQPQHQAALNAARAALEPYTEVAS